MAYVLKIKAFSEAEKRFAQLCNLTNTKNVRVELGVMHNGVLCNDYTIDEEAYRKIRSYLKQTNEDQG